MLAYPMDSETWATWNHNALVGKGDEELNTILASTLHRVSGSTGQ